MINNLASALHQANAISCSQKQQVIELSNQNGCSILNCIMMLNLMSSRELTDAIAPLFNIALVDIKQYDYEALSKALSIRSLIVKHSALPLHQTGQILTIAISDPTNLATEADFSFSTGLQIETLLGDYNDLSGAIRKLFGKSDTILGKNRGDIQEQDLCGLVQDSGYQDFDPKDESSENDAPISRFIHQIITDAIAKGASDIHFEPYEHHFRVRIRCDGILIEVQKPPVHFAQRFASRIKILARLDITNRRLPQDGRIQFSINDNSSNVDLRVSTLPGLWGEKVVLRILDNRASTFDIDALGYNDDQKQLYLDALHKPQGMILVTGPTGSGKTASLYTGLKIINTAEKNICSAEDPVEININGINQVQVDNLINFGFTQALKAFLRQDPDIIMLGEIRDTETASIAIRAAQTGHLVLSTLHTNSAAATIVRLINMGIEPFNITASLSLIIAQRLVRKLCPCCKQLCKKNASSMDLTRLPLNSAIFEPNPQGCINCNKGYQGRVGLFEVLPINQCIKNLIEHNATTAELEQAAIESGMLSLKASAVEKLLNGVTSFSELKRVLLL